MDSYLYLFQPSLHRHVVAWFASLEPSAQRNAVSFFTAVDRLIPTQQKSSSSNQLIVSDNRLSALAVDDPSLVTYVKLYAAKTVRFDLLAFLCDYVSANGVSAKNHLASVLSSVETYVNANAVPTSLYKQSFGATVIDTSQRHSRTAKIAQNHPQQKAQGSPNATAAALGEPGPGMLSTSRATYQWHDSTSSVIEKNFEQLKAHAAEKKQRKQGPTSSGGVVLSGITSTTRAMFRNPNRRKADVRVHGEDANFSAATGRVLMTNSDPHKNQAPASEEVMPESVAFASSTRHVFTDPKGGIERTARQWTQQQEQQEKADALRKKTETEKTQSGMSTARATMPAPPKGFPARSAPFKPTAGYQPFSTQEEGFVGGCMSVAQVSYTSPKKLLQ